MALLTGYYNSLNGDRKYNADDMSRYFAGLYTRGVIQNYKNKFVVTANTGMSVKVPTGKAFFTDGKYIENTADIIIELDPAEVTLNRIDSIVLRNDKNENTRNASVILKKGTPATAPTPPALVNDENVEELCLAEITVNKLVETITQANINNTIPDTAKCGYITGLIEQVDTSDLYLQYQAQMQENIAENQETFDTWLENLQAGFTGKYLLTENSKIIKTTVDNTTTFDLSGLSYNSATDILNVYINGLRVKEGQHYTIGTNNIVLTNALKKNQEVEIVVLKPMQQDAV